MIYSDLFNIALITFGCIDLVLLYTKSPSTKPTRQRVPLQAQHEVQNSAKSLSDFNVFRRAISGTIPDAL